MYYIKSTSVYQDPLSSYKVKYISAYFKRIEMEDHVVLIGEGLTLFKHKYSALAENTSFAFYWKGNKL